MLTIKKALYRVSLLCALACGVFMLTGCADKDQPCEHTYSEWTVTVQPTCETSGEKMRKCTECGHVEAEVIPELGHNFVGGICTVCGKKE
jgi:hypothetical protein